MHPFSFYDRSKLKWTDEESRQLKLLYEEKNLDIIDCANSLKRTPGCVSYKLKSLGIVLHPTLARGYFAYKGSPLYSEVVEKYKKEESESEKKYIDQKKSHHAATLSLSEQLNAKEAQLHKEVEFYKANLEQLIRIYALEQELEYFKGKVAEGYAKQKHEDSIKNEILNPCREHIQKLFQSIITLWMYGDRQKYTDYIELPKLMNGSSPGRVQYKIEQLDDLSFKCTAIGTTVHNICNSLSGIWNGHELVFHD